MTSEGLTVGIPSTLLERLRTRQALLVAGLGSCSLAGLPGWPETLRRMAARLEGTEAAPARRMIEQLLAQGRRAAALAYLRAHLTPRALVESLREAFPQGLPVPEPLALLAGLPWRAVLVTGFDDLWDRALASAPEPFRPLELEALLVAGQPGRYFFHVLGTAEATQHLCLGAADLRRGTLPGPAAALLRESFADRSFVFFGFDPSDPDLGLLTHGLLGGACSRAEHFLLWANAPANERLVELARAELGFTVVPCAGSMDELARRLVEAWRAADAEGRPRDEDVQAWLELVTRHPSDPEPRLMLERLEDQLRAEGGRAGTLVSLLVGRAGLEPERAVSLQLEAARLLADELRRGEAAVALWRRVLARDPTCGEAGERLAAHLRKAERWRDLAETLETMGGAAAEPERRLALWREAAELRAERLRDGAAAAAAWEAVAELAPGDQRALVALEELYEQQGRTKDRLRIQARIRRAEADAAPPERRRELLAALGKLLDEELDDARGAIEVYGAAVALGDEQASTFETLARLHRSVEDWPACVAALDRAAAALAGQGERVAELRVRAAEILRDRLGDPARAEEQCLAALEADAGSVAALDALANVCVARGDYPSAVGFLLDAEARTTDPIRKGRALAEAAAILEDHLHAAARAQQLLERAVGLDPANSAAIARLCAAFERQERWAQAEPLLEQLLQREGGVGRTGRDQLLRRLARAAAAAGNRPRARTVQREVVDQVLAAAAAGSGKPEWTEAVEALEALAAVEEGGARAETLGRAALICRDQLDAPGRAEELLELALEAEPTAVAALDALEGLLLRREGWKELGRLFERVLARVPADGHAPLRARLWHSLGVVSLKFLGDERAARAALEAADVLDPAHPERQVMLAELYLAAGPSEADKAIALHQRLIAADPNRLASYRTLARLYETIGATDELWCVASTLSFLRKAEPPLQEIHQRHRAAALRSPADKLTPELWTRLAHPDEDPLVARLFALIGHLLASEAAESHGDAGLRRDDSVDAQSDQRPAARALAEACRAFDLPVPDLFFSAREPRPVVVRNLKDDGRLTPAVVVGAPLAARTEPQSEVTFAVAHAAALLRPEKFVRCLDGRPVLDDALAAALVLAGARPVGSGAVAELCERLRPVTSGEARDELAELARQLAARGSLPPLDAWRAGADLTAGRAAFALTHDLGAVARAIAADPTTSMTPKRRLKDLVGFSVSETYFSVRRALGVAIR